GSPSLEEDEGFSDWTQRRERRRQQRLQELSQGGEEDEDEEEDTINKAAPAKTVQASVTSSSRLVRQERQGTDRARMEVDRKREREEETVRAERAKREEEEKRKREEVMTKRRGEIQRPKTEVRLPHQTTEPFKILIIQETSDLCPELLETSSASFETNPNHVSVISDSSKSSVRVTREKSVPQEERRRMKEDIERRRMEAAERMKSLSTSSVDGDEMFSPISPKAPTHKITERTESLNRSLKKSNSFKKTQPLVLTSKIDDKLEQYAHAVENSQEARAVKASLSDLPSSPEVVASKKNLFEAGEAWTQSPTKGATCKVREQSGTRLLPAPTSCR
uniref:Lymphocyte specific protein 1 a n=1 Tax=Seriola dumerili TaxID=41447 RepID=A0A3B4UYR1_SERDU